MTMSNCDRCKTRMTGLGRAVLCEVGFITESGGEITRVVIQSWCEDCVHPDGCRPCTVCDTLTHEDALRYCHCDEAEICPNCSLEECPICEEGRALDEAERTAHEAWRRS